MATTTTLATEVNAAVTGQRILLRAAVFAASGSARPTGSVRLRDGAWSSSRAARFRGRVVFTFRRSRWRSPVHADYLPTGPYLPSSSPILIQRVVAAATRTALGVVSSVEINGVTSSARCEVTLFAAVNVLAPEDEAYRAQRLHDLQRPVGAHSHWPGTNGSIDVTRVREHGARGLTATFTEQLAWLGSTRADAVPGGG